MSWIWSRCYSYYSLCRLEPTNPGWYYNLRANPKAKLTIEGETKAYLAREAEGTEREAAWAKAVQMYAGFNVYQKRAGERKIPVILLIPHQAGDK